MKLIKVIGESDIPDELNICMEDGLVEKYEFSGYIYISEEEGVAMPSYTLKDEIFAPWDKYVKGIL